MIDEIIIAVPRLALNHLLVRQPFGFINQDLSNSYELVLNNLVSLDRADAEEDESFKQLIPYVLVKYKQEYFLLKRKNTQTETRLHNKMSIGIGGHINPIDSSQGNDIVISGLIREVQEEISINNFNTPHFLGFINDDTSEVGRVHLGLLFEIESNSSNVDIIEKDKMEGGWASIDDIDLNYDRLESWSKIAFDSYIKQHNKH